MKRFLSHATLLLAGSLLLPVAAHALAFRTYVASYGSGTACSVSSPCRLISDALPATLDNGEIWMLDSANFNSGTVTINKNVSIQAIPGQIGSIVPVAGAPAIIISPGMTVTLRNVAIVTNANNPGTDGIQMTTGRLTLEKSVIEARGYSAIVVNGTGKVAVRDCEFRAGYNTIYAAEGATVSVTGSKFEASDNAFIFAETTTATATQVTVRNSEFANGNYVGVWADATTSASARSRITVADSSLSGNGYAVVTTGSVGVAYASVGSSVIGGNGVALYQSGTGVTETLGNNTVRNNSAATSGTVTTVSPM